MQRGIHLPIPLAKERATLALLSQRRLILGAGIGWMEAEFRPLGAPFHQRNSPPALARALKHDGWHGTRQTPEEAKTLVAALRATRPGPDFTISLRTSWDGQDQNALKSRLPAYAEAGINHVMVEPTDRELDGWLHSVKKIAALGGFKGRKARASPSTRWGRRPQTPIPRGGSLH